MDIRSSISTLDQTLTAARQVTLSTWEFCVSSFRTRNKKKKKAYSPGVGERDHSYQQACISRADEAIFDFSSRAPRTPPPPPPLPPPLRPRPLLSLVLDAIRLGYSHF